MGKCFLRKRNGITLLNSMIGTGRSKIGGSTSNPKQIISPPFDAYSHMFVVVPSTPVNSNSQQIFTAFRTWTSFQKGSIDDNGDISISMMYMQGNIPNQTIGSTNTYYYIALDQPSDIDVNTFPNGKYILYPNAIAIEYQYGTLITADFTWTSPRLDFKPSYILAADTNSTLTYNNYRHITWNGSTVKNITVSSIGNSAPESNESVPITISHTDNSITITEPRRNNMYSGKVVIIATE